LDDLSEKRNPDESLLIPRRRCSRTRGSIFDRADTKPLCTFTSGLFRSDPKKISIAELIRQQKGYATALLKMASRPVKGRISTNPGEMGFDEWLFLMIISCFELNPH